MASGEFQLKQIELIMGLRSRGIRSTKVLSAIEKVPRHLFVSPAFEAQAYADTSLPIECGQTISQPFVVAYMTELLNIGDRDKVLEIGTGSGYQAAVLSHLARRVYTIERYRTLAREAGERFADLGLSNITGMVGDGMRGWPEQAPFDRIIVTAAAEEVPDELQNQLKDGGIMVLPVGPAGGVQHIVRVMREGDNFVHEQKLAVRFVPLVKGRAQQL
ncbi:MAG: protein-L-isoaspartate(D-aspartate) O-methyltransferase [Rhodobiaceae bacterium]|nr:protein-L-isoaspartate(D-aspartate) O-methyltransferase [Rhodobiaceae bacterium]